MSKTNRNENNKKDDFSNQRAEKIASGIPARSAGLLLCLFISLAAAFSLTGPLRAQAGTGSSKTKVIKTTTDESFAVQSAKLAKKNPGLTVKTTGKARPYSSARLIVGLKSGKKVLRFVRLLRKLFSNRTRMNECMVTLTRLTLM